MSEGPVFVTGLADSGKTPLTRMLNTRTSIVITRHTDLWRRFSGRFERRLRGRELDRFLDELRHDPGVTRLEPDVGRLRAELADGTVSVPRILALLHTQHAERSGRCRWGEQDGQLGSAVPQVLRHLPTASVIHLVRDPVVSYRIAVERSGGAPGQLGRFTARWTASVEWALAYVRRYPGRYVVVRYEALAARTDETMRQVCAFLDEPVGDTPFRLATTRATQRSHDGGPSGKYASADGSPLQRTHDGDVRFLAAHASGALRSAGYDARVPEGRAGAAYLARWPVDRLALAVWRVAPTSSVAG
jgi:hypothetical protein